MNNVPRSNHPVLMSGIIFPKLVLMLLTIPAALSAREMQVLYTIVSGTNMGVHLSSMEHKTTKKIISANGYLAFFSPDAQKILFSDLKKLYICDIDGQNKKEIAADAMVDEKRMNYCWTSNGIFYMTASGALMRYIPETGLKSATGFNVSSFGKSRREYNAGEGLQMYMSGDGKNAWFFINLDGNCDATANRGGNVFARFNATWSAASGKDIECDWGHGNGISLSGEYMFMNSFGQTPDGGKKHSNPKTWKWDGTNATLQGPHVVPLPSPFDQEGKNAVIPRCANNDSILGAYGYDSNGNIVELAYNWKTTTRIGTFTRPASGGAEIEDEIYITDIWDGAIAAPTSPKISINQSELIFTVQNTTVTPSSATITVTNSGAGTLGKVTAAENADWLTVSVGGSGGNTQVLTNTITVANLTSDESSATVTVKDGSATNSQQYTVKVYKGNVLQAPSTLTATEGGASLLEATLVWKDNSTDETGFEIERKAGDSGAWTIITTAAANSTSYKDVVTEPGFYTYRVRAKRNTLPSSYSNEVLVQLRGTQWIKIGGPAEGAVLQGGSKHIITWTSNRVSQVKISYQTDAGMSDEFLITKLGGVGVSAPDWQKYEWALPNEDLNDVFIKVVDYSNDECSSESGLFSIKKGNLPAKPRGVFTTQAGLSVVRSNSNVIMRVSGARYTVKLLNQSGRLLREFTGEGASSKTIDPGKLPAGLIFIQSTIDGVTKHSSVVVGAVAK